MAVVVDASSPAIVTQTNGTVAALTTAAFIPPAGSLLNIRWSANSTSLPAQPGIADNLGGGALTYNLIAWQSRSDAPTRDGQAAAWRAAVTAGGSMTVTVTNQASSGFREAALCVRVLTGHDTGDPLGASGKAGSASTAAISQNYTAESTGGLGFLVATDWDALGNMTVPGGGAYTLEGTGGPGGAFNYAFVRRTSSDDVNGVSNTVAANLAGTSTNVAWVYVEINGAVGVVASLPPTQRGQNMGALLQL